MTRIRRLQNPDKLKTYFSLTAYIQKDSVSTAAMKYSEINL